MTLQQATQPILGVTEFPWAKDPPPGVSSASEQHAYMAGMHIARTRRLLNDDGQDLIINWGAGRSPERPAPDFGELRKTGAGSFGIFAALEPADLDLYRRILPEHFAMPERPVLSLITVDYNQPNPIVRYKEGMVMLKGLCADGEESWSVHSMPVESWLMLVMGHDWGFRKDLFDMTVAREKTAVMQRNGDLYLTLELTDEACPGDTEWLVPQEHCGGHNSMAVIYPRRPDLVLRFGWTGKAVALDEEKRAVRISVNRSLDWAGLVPEGATVPGFFQRYTIVGGDPYVKKVRSS